VSTVSSENHITNDIHCRLKKITLGFILIKKILEVAWKHMQKADWA